MCVCVCVCVLCVCMVSFVMHAPALKRSGSSVGSKEYPSMSIDTHEAQKARSKQASFGVRRLFWVLEGVEAEQNLHC